MTTNLGIKLSNKLAVSIGDTDWRQHRYLYKKVKKAFRLAQQTKPIEYKNEERKKKRQEEVAKAYTQYITLAKEMINKSENTIKLFENKGLAINSDLILLKQFIQDGYRQIDQIDRRVLQGEVIPHAEKVFSLHERHTEWVKKGKVKTPVELGKRVCVLEDQFGFILHHKVMCNEVDNEVAVPMVEETLKRFNNLSSCSFDKGFHSQTNRENLDKLLERVILPKKGKLTKAEQERESEPNYRASRRQHSAVESAINALEVHGLDRCLDRGEDGFKRYVALAIVGRNIQQLGALLRSQKRKKQLQKKLAA